MENIKIEIDDNTLDILFREYLYTLNQNPNISHNIKSLAPDGWFNGGTKLMIQAVTSILEENPQLIESVRSIKTVFIGKESDAEKNLREYINNSVHNSISIRDKNKIHGWLDQILGLSNGIIISLKDGILFIDGIICTFETKEIRTEIENMVETESAIETNKEFFILPVKFTYETIAPNGNIITKIKLKQ